MSIANKTEVIWIGSRVKLAKTNICDCSVRVGSESIKPSNAVRDLGVPGRRAADHETAYRKSGSSMLLPSSMIRQNVRFAGESR